MTSAVAARYARALADVVTAPDSGIQPPQAVEQIRAVQDVVASSHDLRTALETPAIRNQLKRAVLGRIAGDLGLSRVIRNFLFVLVDHRRMTLLPQIRDAFEQEMDARMGFVFADISSAHPLSPEQAGSVEAELSHATGKRIRPRYAVDPALIGGVVARISSTVYDGSIRGQLDNMRRQFAQDAAAGIQE